MSSSAIQHFIVLGLSQKSSFLFLNLCSINYSVWIKNSLAFSSRSWPLQAVALYSVFHKNWSVLTHVYQEHIYSLKWCGNFLSPSKELWVCMSSSNKTLKEFNRSFQWQVQSPTPIFLLWSKSLEFKINDRTNCKLWTKAEDIQIKEN